jgi:adenylate cyclase
VINASLLFFSNSLFIAVLLYATGLIAIILFLFEINDNLGQGIVINYLTGKYHKPRKETRIFLFLDMKSSTSIAENLGHTKYFEFLKAYYADMTKSIEKYSGYIYQYVGDEVVISWDQKSGFKNNNCLECFLSIKKTFSDKRSKYENKFGVAPRIKAGIHLGVITTGEIGVLKKEILFTGDVLNTTSRIENLCNTYGVDCIVSEDLLVNLNLNSNLIIDNIGVCKLRGKNNEVKLYSVIQKEPVAKELES